MIKKLVISLTLITLINSYAQQNSNGVVVLELFTSQGCSSCPPADELLDEIKKEYEGQNVFALSYHVDYWNRLGWKDPFSSVSYSDYQRDYAVQFNSRSIYTPQLVVNGSEHFTGSNSYKANTALKKYTKSKISNSISLQNIKREDEQVSLFYKIQGEEFNKVTIALVVSERITTIPRGENRNRTLKNTNIVANRIVKSDSSGSVTIEIPDWIASNDQLSIIAYTQDSSLETTGATKNDI